MKVGSEIDISKNSRNYALDMIKAISICFVVVWHVIPLRSENIILKGFISLFTANITLIGVPSFITVSLIIFIKKHETAGQDYLRKRIVRLVNIFIFWFIIQNILHILTTQHIPDITFKLFMKGGPGLPVVGGSVFYFLTHLIVLTCLLNIFLTLSIKNKNITSIIVVIITLIYFMSSTIFGYKAPYSYLLSFLIYIPLSYYLVTNFKIFSNNRYYLVFLFIIAACLERVMSNIYNVPSAPYSRISILLGVVTLYVFVSHSKIRKNAILEIFSRYSLGIFAVHKYFQLLSCFLLFGLIDEKFFNSIESSWHYPIMFFMTIFMTALFLFLMRRSWIRYFLV